MQSSNKMTVSCGRNFDNHWVKDLICGNVIESPAEDAEQQNEDEEASYPCGKSQFVVGIEV